MRSFIGREKEEEEKKREGIKRYGEREKGKDTRLSVKRIEAEIKNEGVDCVNGSVRMSQESQKKGKTKKKKAKEWVH